MNLTRQLPRKFTTVNPEAWPRIYAYCVMFVIAVVGNLVVLLTLCGRRRRKISSMDKLIAHLCVADLTVAFFYMAVEVYWRISIGWYAGEFMCKLIQFFRAFGLYLSSFILMCISLDRYYVVAHPLKSITSSKRVRCMIISSWSLAALCAFPQCIIFREEPHPYFPDFKQCVTISWGEAAEIANTAFSLAIIYFLPLCVIIFSYCNIVCKLFIRSRRSSRDNSSDLLRQSGSSSLINRAKIRTLKLSIVIVLVFEVCWTPYVTISIWHIVDRKSAENLDVRIQDTLFMMSCATACVNSFVYGCFSHGCIRHRRSNSYTRSTTVFKSTIRMNRLNRASNFALPSRNGRHECSPPIELRHIKNSEICEWGSPKIDSV